MAINLLTEWSSQEDETGTSMGLAKACAKLTLKSKNAVTAQRFLTILLQNSPEDSQVQYLLSNVYALQGKRFCAEYRRRICLGRTGRQPGRPRFAGPIQDYLVL